MAFEWREAVEKILGRATGNKLHYEVVATKLAEAFQAAQPGSGEEGDLKLLALANVPLDFCNEMDPFVRCPAASSKKRKAATMDMAERMEITNAVFLNLGEMILTKFLGSLGGGPRVGKILGGCQCDGKENSFLCLFGGDGSDPADPHNLWRAAINHCNNVHPPRHPGHPVLLGSTRSLL